MAEAVNKSKSVGCSASGVSAYCLFILFGGIFFDGYPFLNALTGIVFGVGGFIVCLINLLCWREPWMAIVGMVLSAGVALMMTYKYFKLTQPYLNL